ncbi:MAG: hypothetical protein AAFR61_22120 [Bacteroidota bacterium]
MESPASNTWARQEKGLFWAAVAVAAFFLLIWGSFQLQWEPIWLGVIRELFTLPLMAGQLILPVLAFLSWRAVGWKMPSYAVAALGVSLITIGLTIGSLILAF